METELAKTHDAFKAYEQLDLSEVKTKYTDTATKYAFAVMDKKLVTGYHIQLACLRHLRDLKKSIENADYKFKYDTDEANQILKFAALCPEAESRQPVALMDWQKFILSMLNGWRTKTNYKRFSKAIVSIARHNGKTYLMAIIIAYGFLIESIGKSNQQFLVSSITSKQSKQLMGYVKEMLTELFSNQTSIFYGFNEEIGIDLKSLISESDMIIAKNNGNKIVQITFNSGSYDGFHFQTAIGDEFGSSKADDKRKLNSITSGQTMGVESPQFIRISTAYDDPEVEFHHTEERVMQEIENDSDTIDRELVLNWAQDSLEETYMPETWAKSNPLLNLKGHHDGFIAGLESEKNSSLINANIGGFQNKSLNMWLKEKENAFLKLDDVQAAVIPQFPINGRDVYVGFDYSMSSDNTAFAFVYPYQDNGVNKYHIEQHSFVPWYAAGSMEAKEKTDGIPYRELAKQGYCTITSHMKGLIDQDQIYHWLLDYVDEHQLNVRFFGYDAMGVNKFIENMDHNTNFPLNAVRQRTDTLKNPTKFLQQIFVEGTVSRLDDLVMEKALLNAHIKEDKIGIQVDKYAASLKIDVVDAIIDALYQAMYEFTDFAFETDAESQVKRMTQEEILNWMHDPESGMM